MFWEQYSHEPAVAVARFQVKYLGKPAVDLDPQLVKRAAAVSGGWRSNHDSINPTNYAPYLDRGYTVFAVCHGCQLKQRYHSAPEMPYCGGCCE